MPDALELARSLRSESRPYAQLIMEVVMRKKMTGMLAVLLFTASLLAGCETRNSANQNTNHRAATNANANNSGWNVNLSRDEFEKQKDRFAEEAKKLGHKVGTGSED